MGTKNNMTETTEDRFTLEEAIVACFNVADDLALVEEEILEGTPDPDTLATLVSGIAATHKLRCDKLFRIFSQLIEARKIL